MSFLEIPAAVVPCPVPSRLPADETKARMTFFSRSLRPASRRFLSLRSDHKRLYLEGCRPGRAPHWVPRTMRSRLPHVSWSRSGLDLGDGAENLSPVRIIFDWGGEIAFTWTSHGLSYRSWFHFPSLRAKPAPDRDHMTRCGAVPLSGARISWDRLIEATPLSAHDKARLGGLRRALPADAGTEALTSLRGLKRPARHPAASHAVLVEGFTSFTLRLPNWHLHMVPFGDLYGTFFPDLSRGDAAERPDDPDLRFSLGLVKDAVNHYEQMRRGRENYDRTLRRVMSPWI